MNQSSPQVIANYLLHIDQLAYSNIPAQSEDTLKVPVSNLVLGIAQFGKRIDIATEASYEGSRPDIGVSVDGLLCGYIELKAPSKSISPASFKGHDREQWEKFKSIPNLIYTNGLHWIMYRYGEAQREVFLPAKGSKITRFMKVDHEVNLTTLFELFFSWQPIVPSTPMLLAETLAPLCRILRDDVFIALQNNNEALISLEKEWHDILFSNTDRKQFADAYAQTITYALLLAKMSGLQEVKITTAVETLRAEHNLLSRALEILTDPAATEVIGIGLQLLTRSISAVDPSKLPAGGEDVWLFFYEHFLAKYDKALRKNRGVYYTPAQVVKAQVKMVSDVLINQFNKRWAFASDDISVIDPAAGTGSYPLSILSDCIERFGHFGEAQIASKLAENIYAFEILVGPYAVAHLRLTQSLLGIPGTSLPKEGVHVYLTDTLESPRTNPTQATLHSEPLSKEHTRALEVKKNARITVCIGNPPYDRQTLDIKNSAEIRKGGWIRYGDSDAGIDVKPILEDFIRPTSEAGFGIHLKNLYNDYVYFWRWALWKVFESTSPNDEGIICFITASSYLNGPGYIGMRKHMRNTFSEMWIVDLEGDSYGSRVTENVFDIKTPVAIALGIKTKNSSSSCKVHYTRITGTREQKLDRLSKINSVSDFDWKECYSEDFAPFLPVGSGIYYQWPKLTKILPKQFSGVQFVRTWPINPSASVLDKRWRRLIECSANEKEALFRESRDRSISSSLRDPITRELLPSIAQETSFKPFRVFKYAYRSFDIQWALFDTRVCDYIRPELLRLHSPNQLYMASLLTGVLGYGPGATITTEVPDYHFFKGSGGGKHIVPLWLDASCTIPNVNSDLLRRLGHLWKSNVDAVDVFYYCFCVVSCPAYTQRFMDELSEPGIRVPISLNKKLFIEAVELGKRLINIQTKGGACSGSKNLSTSGHHARIGKNLPISVNDFPETFVYDSEIREIQMCISVGKEKRIVGTVVDVLPEIWDYEISGRRVVLSWLQSRARDGSGRKSSSLEDIRMNTWDLKYNSELLELIWMLEEIVEIEPQQESILTRIISEEAVQDTQFVEMQSPTKSTDIGKEETSLF